MIWVLQWYWTLWIVNWKVGGRYVVTLLPPPFESLVSSIISTLSLQLMFDDIFSVGRVVIWCYLNCLHCLLLLCWEVDHHAANIKFHQISPIWSTTININLNSNCNWSVELRLWLVQSNSQHCNAIFFISALYKIFLHLLSKKKIPMKLITYLSLIIFFEQLFKTIIWVPKSHI